MSFITRLLSEENLHAFGWTVLHSLWQAFLVALIMGIALLFLQKRSARFRYNLANAGLLIVLLLSIFTFFNIKYGASALTAPEITLLVDPQLTQVETEGLTFKMLWSRFLFYFNTHLPLVVSIWLLGLAFFVLRMLGSLAYVQHLRLNGREVTAEWQARLDDVAEALSVSRPVRLLESALIKVPVAAGILKPVILLPVGVINGLSPAEVEAVLAHELAHIRRHDYLLNILQSIIEVLYYFNPAVWWISANIRQERENCCDDLAVAYCGNSLIYAKTLVRVQELSRGAPAFAMAFSGAKNQMLHRVKRILNHPTNSSNIMEKLTTTLLLLLAIAVISISANHSLENMGEEERPIPLVDAQDAEWVVLEKLDAAGTPAVHISVKPADQSAVLPEESLEAIFLHRDSLPKGKTSLKLTHDGQKIEAKIKEGKITLLKIDGREIPADEYEDYELLLEEVLAEAVIPVPPAPPIPPMPPMPSMPSMPALPSTPHLAPAPPTPPTPPTPPSPEILRLRKAKKITTREDENGNTVLIIEADGNDPMELTFDGGQSEFFLNGELLEEGQNLFIEEGDRPYFGYAYTLTDSLKGNFSYRYHGDSDLFFFKPEMNGELKALQEDKLKLLQEEIEKLEDQIVDEQKLVQELKEVERERHVKEEKEIRTRLRELELKEKEMLAKIKEEIRRDNVYFAPAIAHEYTRGYWDGKMQSRLEKEMIADGLIESANEYELELSIDRLRINGKKQSESLLRKYLEIYRDVAGKALEGKTRLVIDKSSQAK